jgi:hypothetical protein
MSLVQLADVCKKNNIPVVYTYTRLTVNGVLEDLSKKGDS